MPFDLQLAAGGAVQVWPNQVTIVDQNGTPVTFTDIDDDTIGRLLSLAEHGTNGIAYVNAPAMAVVVAWINTEDDGAYVYVHTLDRTESLAPIYITARERFELRRR